MFKEFITKLNTRQLIIHFVATWLFIYAIHTLASLYDYSFLYKEFAKQNRVIFKDRYANDLFIIQTSGYLGLIVAYIISWQLSIKRNWFWANAVIVFLTAFVLCYFDLLGWKKLSNIFLAPGDILSDVSTLAGVIFNGLYMIAIGSLLFFSKVINGYIDRGVKREKKAPAPRAPKAAKAK